jgi:hypothetical protein
MAVLLSPYGKRVCGPSAAVVMMLFWDEGRPGRGGDRFDWKPLFDFLGPRSGGEFLAAREQEVSVVADQSTEANPYSTRG